jgi:YafQ family addiction module toxin component
MYSFERSEKLIKILKKLYKKDRSIYEIILKKMDEVINSYSPDHYKNLSYDMKNYKRVHVGSFILTFKVDESKKLIRFENFKHHDDMYRR